MLELEDHILNSFCFEQGFNSQDIVFDHAVVINVGFLNDETVKEPLVENLIKAAHFSIIIGVKNLFLCKEWARFGVFNPKKFFLQQVFLVRILILEKEPDGAEADYPHVENGAITVEKPHFLDHDVLYLEFPDFTAYGIHS